jgi:hypothetical protein
MNEGFPSCPGVGPTTLNRARRVLRMAGRSLGPMPGLPSKSAVRRVLASPIGAAKIAT